MLRGVPAAPGPAAVAPIVFAWGDDAFAVRQVIGQVARELAGHAGSPPTIWRLDASRRGAVTDDAAGDSGGAADSGGARDGDGTPIDAGPETEVGRAGRSEASSLEDIRVRVATASLFGDGVLVAVHDPAGLVRSGEGRDRLLALPRAVAPGNGLVFTELVEVATREAAATATFRRALAASVEEAGGRVQHCVAPKVGELEGWITRRAAELGVRLEPGASRLLVDRLGGAVREGDVDRRRLTERADDELSKLALLRPGGTATKADVAALVAPVVPASAWAFLDAVGRRNAGDALAMAERLLAEGWPVQVMVTQLHHRLRQLVEIQDRLASGARVPAIASAMRLNPYRADVLARQAGAWSAAELDAALRGLLDVDLATKGLGPDGARTGAVARGPVAVDLWIAEVVGRRNPTQARPAAGRRG